MGTDRSLRGSSPAEGAERIGLLGGVELWRFPLDVSDDAVQRHWGNLSPEERARAERIRRGPRERFVVARGQLRCILAAVLRVPPSAVAFRSGPSGKPFLVAGPRFNLSHGGGLGVCAVSSGPEVGVDVELLHPVPEAEQIAARWLGSQAAAEVERAGHERDAVFLRHWTRREAYLKLLGIGITDAGGPGPEAPAPWTIFDLDPAPGYVGALAVAGPDPAGGGAGSRRAGGAAPGV